MPIPDEVLARVVHGAIRAFCEAVGDPAVPAWDEAEDWQRKDSLRVVQFHRANPDASASVEHERWREQKVNDGWTYGPVKDSAAKTSPWLVPFEDLTEVQQAKDKLIKAIVNGLS